MSRAGLGSSRGGGGAGGATTTGTGRVTRVDFGMGGFFAGFAFATTFFEGFAFVFPTRET
jgi:hypothetical protein